MSVLLRGVRLYGEGDRVDVLVDDGQPHGAQSKLADLGRHLVQLVRPVVSG